MPGRSGKRASNCIAAEDGGSASVKGDERAQHAAPATGSRSTRRRRRESGPRGRHTRARQYQPLVADAADRRFVDDQLIGRLFAQYTE